MSPQQEQKCCSCCRKIDPRGSDLPPMKGSAYTDIERIIPLDKKSTIPYDGTLITGMMLEGELGVVTITLRDMPVWRMDLKGFQEYHVPLTVNMARIPAHPKTKLLILHEGGPALAKVQYRRYASREVELRHCDCRYPNEWPVEYYLAATNR